MKEITITMPLNDWRAVCMALKYQANRWYNGSYTTKKQYLRRIRFSHRSAV